MNARLIELLKLVSDMTGKEKKQFMKLLHQSNEGISGRSAGRRSTGMGEFNMSPSEFQEYGIQDLVKNSRANNIDNYPRAMAITNEDQKRIESIIEALISPQKRSGRPTKPRPIQLGPERNDVPF